VPRTSETHARRIFQPQNLDEDMKSFKKEHKTANPTLLDNDSEEGRNGELPKIHQANSKH